MTTLVFMRHGETTWNRAGRYLSRTDIPLHAEGAAAVRVAAPALKVLASPFFVSSPLLRARETAAIVAGVLGMNEPEIWDDLREVDFGVFEGETEQTASRGAYASQFSAWRDPLSGNLGPPEGETWSAVDARARRVLERLQSEERDALVVSHGSFIRAILAHAVLGMSSHHLRRFRLENAAFVVLSGSPSKWVVAGHNVRALPFSG